MLRLWLSAAPSDGGNGQAGSYALGVVGEGLRLLNDTTDLEQPTQAWLISVERATDLALVAAAATTGRDLLVIINGLGDRALAATRAAAGSRLTLTFDARGLDGVPLVEQLAWLCRQPEPFALVAEDETAALLATMAGAAALVIPGAGFDPATVLRVLSAIRPGAPRPISPVEVDGVESRESCLTVRRPYVAGEILRAEDVALAVTETRGLSPVLQDKVIGLRLRYPLAPGEPLHFAHFEDPAP